MRFTQAATICFLLSWGTVSLAQDDENAGIVRAEQEFAFRSFAELPAGNLVYSPLSAMSLLATLREGAQEDTRDEISAALGWPNDDQFAKLAKWVKQLDENLDDPRQEAKWRCVSSLWIQNGISRNPAFEKWVAPVCPTVWSVNFINGRQQAAAVINDWGRQASNNAFPQLISANELDRETLLLAINVTMFDMKWSTPFSERLTRDAEFYVSAEKTVSHRQMIKKRARLRIAKSDSFLALELPYRGENAAMMVILPHEVDGLKDVERSFGREQFLAVLDAFKKQAELPVSGMGFFQISAAKPTPAELEPLAALVNVSLPRFRFGQGLPLKPLLKALGVESAFDPARADFSAMVRHAKIPLYFRDVYQQTMIEVNEQGTKAAAVTKGSFGGGSTPEIVDFTADHPFLFVIYEKANNSILFLGRVTDPTAGP